MKGKKILIMGLPGSGKTTLAKQLVNRLPAVWFNADEIRNNINKDLGFADQDRVEQARRLGLLCDIALRNRVVGYALADFVCPTDVTRKTFNPDIIVWMNTIREGRFEDTNRVFENPDFYNIEITSWDYDIDHIFEQIKLHDR
jgi:cytidylate kinase